MLDIPGILVDISEREMQCQTCFNKIPIGYGYVKQLFNDMADSTTEHHIDCFVPQMAEYMGQVIAWKKDLDRIANKGPPYDPRH